MTPPSSEIIVPPSTASTTAPPDNAGSERDLQRTALRELVELAETSARKEREIAQRYQAESESAGSDLERAVWLIEQRYNSTREGTQEKHDLKNLEIERQYENEMGATKNADDTSQRRINLDRETAERGLKKEMDQAIWLAESLHEGSLDSAREEYKTAETRSEAHRNILDHLGQRAADQIMLYRQNAPEIDLPPTDTSTIPEDPEAEFERLRQEAEQHLDQLGSLKIANMFVGAYPFVGALGVILVSAGIAQATTGTLQPHADAIWIGLGIGVFVAAIGGVLLRTAARKQVAGAYLPFLETIAAAHRAAKADVIKSGKQRERQIEHATRRREMEIIVAKDRFQPMIAQAHKRHTDAMQFAKMEFARQATRIEEIRSKTRRELTEWYDTRKKEMTDAQARETEEARVKGAARKQANETWHDRAMADLRRHWSEGLARIQAPISDSGRTGGQAIKNWDDPAWKSWDPPHDFPPAVRFGEMQVNLNQLTSTPPKELKLPEMFSVPALLAFPRQSSLMIHTDHAGRADAIRVMQMVMARLLTGLPPGRAHFTIIDPVGLGQSFAGFMHLADHDEALVGQRIWTEREHIEQRLANMTEHMETVIQKYLRNEFETIDDYNAQAGELAEPYRFLVIADFPTGLEGDSFRRLASIASSGARCGVYTLIIHDTGTPLPQDARLAELEAHSINLDRKAGKFVWRDEVFARFPLQLDPPAPEGPLNEILDVVGRRARENKRVEVDFRTIAPATQQIWTGSSRSDLQVAVGRLGATRLQMMRLGKGVAQHALIAGKTGSGKSTLLHVLVTNLAMWYSPDEVEFYLVDFKKGVEFKTYATHLLPHARAVAVESDREFGLSVLQRIDAELTRRGDLFRKAGVQDLASYRDATGQPMPRTLLMIDEFQEFFSEDDKLAQDASVLLDRLVRQGRAFGVHVLLGSQTIGGTSGLARSTIGQMAVRIALQTSEADSQLILGDNNSAARLLTRPGEAIYNDQGGLVEGNSPFQVAWLPDEQRDHYLDLITERASSSKSKPQEPIVFEGNAPADIWKNARLRQLLDQSTKRTSAPVAWLGDPVAIKDPTAITFRRQSGANALIVGQQDESALAVTASSIISLAAQHLPGSALFYLMDGTPADAPLAGLLQKVASAIAPPHDVRNIEWRAVPEAIGEIAAEVQRRQSDESPDAPEIYLVIFGLQRYRMLRKSEESFGFSGGDEDKKPQPEKQFADILRDGPAVGVHVITWADTPATLDRTFDRASMREFDNRVLFQMSAADSSNLIDSPAANKLGTNRALSYSEEQGVMEKFRPYGLPTVEWLSHVASKFHAKSS
jgi:DNA segregation ATPase FtsK/SpoIIIE-like protein